MTTTTPTRAPHARSRSLTWHAAALVLLLVLLYPVVWVFTSSVKPASEIISSFDLLPSRLDWSGFGTALDGIGDVPAWRFFFNSLVLALGSVLGNVLSCSIAAYAFARLRFRGRGAMFAVMIGTILLPTHLLLIPQYTMFQKAGLVDTYVPLLLGKFLATDAFFVFLMVQFVRNLPRSLDEAALIDGCGHFRIFGHIVLPLLRPALITTAIFTFIWSWNDFFAPLIYLQSPEKYPLPLALRLFVDSTSSQDYGAMLGMSVLSLLPVIAFFVAFQRLLIEGAATSGMKG
ncbi:carbohydrate ABC transporter permease [Streptomyces sp. SID14478]|uniref:carbohydrate ABC transporter permease n=1 Tax=Streptomyces sp. SID14478 TaxID=2706073 RepID=UPI0013D8F6C0|nr:carbohydrate ABC transporter permease [Streptomyces sp. SID14478]NEB77700.1 carbohydrate ABC transporter permease [Streptomyces sp. SID14478]